MPAPMTPFVPTTRTGQPAPGFGRRGIGMSMNSTSAARALQGMGMGGMGDMLPMANVNPGAAGAGPWLTMQQYQGGGQQGPVGDWVITGPEVYPAGQNNSSFLTMPIYDQAVHAPMQPQGPPLSGMGFLPDMGSFFNMKALLGLGLGAGAIYYLFLRKKSK